MKPYNECKLKTFVQFPIFPIHKPGFGCQCQLPDVMPYLFLTAAFLASLMVMVY